MGHIMIVRLLPDYGGNVNVQRRIFGSSRALIAASLGMRSQVFRQPSNSTNAEYMRGIELLLSYGAKVREEGKNYVGAIVKGSDGHYDMLFELLRNEAE